MTCSRRGFLGGCITGVLVAAVPAAHAAPRAGAIATSVSVPIAAAHDARAGVRLQHAPTSFVHLPSPRTSAGAHAEHRRVHMQRAPLRRCAA